MTPFRAHFDFHWVLKEARSKGFKISIGQRMTSGPLLLVSGHAQTAAAITDLATLNEKYAEVGIQGMHNVPTVYISVPTLIDNPQMHVGYHLSGWPLFLGVNSATEGHILVLGQSRTGKTTKISSIAYQASRLGIPVIFLGLKDLDPMPLASLRAAAESPTRFKNGKAVGAPFRFVTMRPGTATGAVNFLDQDTFDLPLWMRTGDLLHALLPGKTESDPVLRYYTMCAQDLFQKTPWGKSPREFDANLRALKLTRDTLYSTGGERHGISQLAAIEQLNLPKSHPASIDLCWIIANGGAVYFDACFQAIGPIATAVAGLFASAVISAKRRVNPSRSFIIFLIIDEAQQFPREFLKQIIEQCASSGIRVVACCHNLSQLGDDWESISMTQCRFIFGAVAGSKTEEHLKASFGTKKEYPFSFSEGAATSHSSSVTSGPGGVSVSDSVAQNQQFGFGFSEREVFAWSPMDTLHLNHDREFFVLGQSPAAELSNWGPKPIVCQQGGAHISFDEVNRLTLEALADTRNAIVPGARVPELAVPPALPPALKEKRALWLDILESTASRIRKEIVG